MYILNYSVPQKLYCMYRRVSCRFSCLNVISVIRVKLHLTIFSKTIYFDTTWFFFKPGFHSVYDIDTTPQFVTEWKPVFRDNSLYVFENKQTFFNTHKLCLETAVTRKWFGLADCDTIYNVYLSLNHNQLIGTLFEAHILASPII